jgi:hypothetical protein
MRKFTAAAALFAIGLAGYPAEPVQVNNSHVNANRAAAMRRAPSRGSLIARESMAAVHAAGTARARVTQTSAGQQVTATSWLRLSGVDPAPADIVVTPDAEAAQVTADPAAVDGLRRILDPRAAAALFTVAKDVRRMGPARVSGQVAVRYRLSIDLPPRLRLEESVAGEIAALRQSGQSTVTADVWLDQAKRPVRVTLTAAEPDGTPAQTFDCRYYDWGAMPDAAAPDAASEATA